MGVDGQLIQSDGKEKCDSLLHAVSWPGVAQFLAIRHKFCESSIFLNINFEQIIVLYSLRAEWRKRWYSGSTESGWKSVVYINELASSRLLFGCYSLISWRVQNRVLTSPFFAKYPVKECITDFWISQWATHGPLLLMLWALTLLVKTRVLFLELNLIKIPLSDHSSYSFATRAGKTLCFSYWNSGISFIKRILVITIYLFLFFSFFRSLKSKFSAERLRTVGPNRQRYCWRNNWRCGHSWLSFRLQRQERAGWCVSRLDAKSERWVTKKNMEAFVNVLVISKLGRFMGLGACEKWVISGSYNSFCMG